MNHLEIEAFLQNLDTRVTTTDQILPTLPTRDELKTAIATQSEELRGEMRTLGDHLRGEMRALGDQLRAEMKAMRDELRDHFNAVAERLESQISLIAEGHGYLASRMGAFELKVDGRFNDVDRRLDRIEARLGKRNRGS